MRARVSAAIRSAKISRSRYRVLKRFQSYRKRRVILRCTSLCWSVNAEQGGSDLVICTTILVCNGGWKCSHLIYACHEVDEKYKHLVYYQTYFQLHIALILVECSVLIFIVAYGLLRSGGFVER